MAAGGIVAANELLFAPVADSSFKVDFNWRLIPATGILALVLTGVEKISPDFGNALGMLVLGAVLIIPVGNAPGPIDNIAKVVNPNAGNNK